MEIFSKKIDDKIIEYTFSSNGIRVSIINLGCSVTEISVEDKQGESRNIVMAYNDYSDYYSNKIYLGSIIGRVAGKISGAKIKIGEYFYKLDRNDGENSLHGGLSGLSTKIWDSKIINEFQKTGVMFCIRSPHLEGGYPGNLIITAKYYLDSEGALHIEYRARSDRNTALNLSNHIYFNLSGDFTSGLDGHEFKIPSFTIYPTDAGMECKNIYSKKIELNQYRQIEKERAKTTEAERVADFDYIYKMEKGEISARDIISRRKMNIYTNQDSVVFYTGKYIDKYQKINGGIKGFPNMAFCIEPLKCIYTDNRYSPENYLLKADDEYFHYTKYIFE